MAFTRLSRFAGFSGFDFVLERSVLQSTLGNGYWDPSLGYVSNYQASLAITILPSMTSGIINVPGVTTFLFQTFFLIALLPLAMHFIINSMTGDFRLATLSSLLLAQNWFFFGQHLIGKTAVALVLCVLAFYCLIHRNRNFRILGVFLSLGVVMTHYTVSLLLAFILLSYFAFSKIVIPIFAHVSPFRKSSPITVMIAPVAASLALIILWLGFAAPLVLPAATSSVQQALGSIGQIASGPKRADTSLVVSTSAGIIVTVWFNFQNALIALGGLLLLNRYRIGLIRDSLATWTLICISLITLLGAWIVLPYLSVEVESTRILSMILPFAIIFLGAFLLRAAKSPSRIATIVVLAVVFLMLPMNLMLSNQDRNIFYHAEGSLPLDRRFASDTSLVPSYSNYAVAVWASNYLPSNRAVEVDAVGRYALITALPFPPKLSFSQEQLPPYTFHRYSVLSSYFVEDRIWSATILGAGVSIPGQDASFFFSPAHNVLYSSPKFWVMSPAS